MTIANYIFGKYNLIWGCRLYLVILLFYYDNPTFSVNIIVTRERPYLLQLFFFTKGKLQNHKWENALTVDKHSWGYRRNVGIESYLNISQLIYQLASTVR